MGPTLLYFVYSMHNELWFCLILCAYSLVYYNLLSISHIECSRKDASATFSNLSVDQTLLLRLLTGFM